MRQEMLCEQVRRIAKECARRGGVQADHVEDCAMNFLLGKFAPEDFRLPAWQGEEVSRLTAMAAKYVQGYLRRLHTRAKREVSLTGEDGTEASGPARQLVSQEPGPEEQALCRELREMIATAKRSLTPAQLELFEWCFEQEERSIDLMEATGRSAGALRVARFSLRERIRKLLLAAGWTT